MEQIFKWLAVLGRLGSQYADQRFKELDFNSCHHAFIKHICKTPGITQDRLRTLVYVHPSNITRALDHLEKQGYITKETLPTDRRTCRLYPTDKARKIHGYIQEVVEDWVMQITKDMDEGEIQAFHRALEQAGKSAAEVFFPAEE